MNLKYEKTKKIEFEDLTIIVKQYIPFSEKQLFVDKVGNSYFNNEVPIFSEFKKDFTMFLCIIDHYTDLDIPEDGVTEFYDQIVGSGLYEKIIDAIPNKEIEYLKLKIQEMIWEKEVEIEKENSIESVIDRFLVGLIDQLDKFNKKVPSGAKLKNLIEKSVPKMIDGIKPEKLEYLSKAIGYNNGISKPQLNREQRRTTNKEVGSK